MRSSYNTMNDRERIFTAATAPSMMSEYWRPVWGWHIMYRDPREAVMTEIHANLIKTFAYKCLTYVCVLSRLCGNKVWRKLPNITSTTHIPPRHILNILEASFCIIFTFLQIRNLLACRWSWLGCDAGTTIIHLFLRGILISFLLCCCASNFLS